MWATCQESSSGKRLGRTRLDASVQGGRGKRLVTTVDHRSRAPGLAVPLSRPLHRRTRRGTSARGCTTTNLYIPTVVECRVAEG